MGSLKDGCHHHRDQGSIPRVWGGGWVLVKEPGEQRESDIKAPSDRGLGSRTGHSVLPSSSSAPKRTSHNGHRPAASGKFQSLFCFMLKVEHINGKSQIL